MTAGCFTSILEPIVKRFRRQRRDQAASDEKSLNAIVTKKPDAAQSSFPREYLYNESWAQKSSEKLPSYRSVTEDDDDGNLPPAVVHTLEQAIDSANKDLRALSLDIHDHPELGFEEKHAHQVMTKFLAKRGWDVTPSYLGLETAWKATYTSPNFYLNKGRTIGFNSEMDALPGIGHACGHNLIAIGGIAAAMGVRAVLEEHGVAGRVVLLGTPAEEGGNGKVILIDRGGYKEMDACLMMHPGAGPARTTGTGPSLAIAQMNVEFFGHAAHAAASPWEGKNALDAAFLVWSAISALRQQIKPSHRVHGIIEGKNWAPNIIPDYSKMRYLVRAPSKDEVVVLKERVENCFKAAALATGCELKIDSGESDDDFVFDLRQNSELTRNFASIVKKYGYKNLADMEGAIGGSTDFGNVTYAVPALHPSYVIPTKGGNHTKEFTEAARTEEAHAITLYVAKGIALTGYRVLVDDEYFRKVREAFEQQSITVEPTAGP